MKALRVLSLVVFMTTAIVVPSSVGLAGDGDAFPICIGTKHGALGAPTIDLTLRVSSAGSFFQLTGRAQFSQPVTPPGNLVIYSVSGTAIPNADGFWISLVGTGYDVAKTVFIGMFGLQLSDDPTKDTLTYAKQSLDAASTATFTGVPEIKTCP